MRQNAHHSRDDESVVGAGSARWAWASRVCNSAIWRSLTSSLGAEVRDVGAEVTKLVRGSRRQRDKFFIAMIGSRSVLCCAALTLAGCTFQPSIQDQARQQEAQAQRIAAVQTQIALDRAEATTEAVATQQAAQVVAAQTAAPARATATAMAQGAANAALGTQSAIQATATVAIAAQVAQAQATQQAYNAAWLLRRNAAAPYLGGFGYSPDGVCPHAGQMADQTDSVQAAIDAAKKTSGTIPGYNVHCEGFPGR